MVRVHAKGVVLGRRASPVGAGVYPVGVTQPFLDPVKEVRAVVVVRPRPRKRVRALEHHLVLDDARRPDQTHPERHLGVEVAGIERICAKHTVVDVRIRVRVLRRLRLDRVEHVVRVRVRVLVVAYPVVAKRREPVHPEAVHVPEIVHRPVYHAEALRRRNLHELVSIVGRVVWLVYVHLVEPRTLRRDRVKERVGREPVVFLVQVHGIVPARARPVVF